MLEQTKLEVTEAIKLFEYEKANEGYWDRPKLHEQVVNKAFLIIEALYPGYSLIFYLITQQATLFTQTICYTLQK